MKILLVSRYKPNFADHQLPFVTEQGEALRAAGCEVEYYLIRGGYLQSISKLRQHIRASQPDIVHGHYGLSAIVAVLAAQSSISNQQSAIKVTPPKAVVTFHNGEWHNWWVNFLSSLIARRAQHLIYVAPHIREKMYFKHPHYSIIPCGVDMEAIQPIDYHQARTQLGWSDDKRYILFGGAFANTRKNVALLRAALDVLHRDDIVLIEMRGMDRATVNLHLSACDVFALPTLNEGSPQALKEAMACNCSIVATDVADIRHLLGDLPGHYIISNPCGSATGWVGNEHSVQECADLLTAALSLPTGFRTHGRDRIMELGLTNEQVAQRLMEIYDEL